MTGRTGGLRYMLRLLGIRIAYVGARARNRTENLGIKSPLLCQLSYAGASADFDRSRPWILLP
jgi:hypothetical protein